MSDCAGHAMSLKSMTTTGCWPAGTSFRACQLQSAGAPHPQLGKSNRAHHRAACCQNKTATAARYLRSSGEL